MKASIPLITVRIFLATGLILALNACEASSEQIATYDEICQIYAAVSELDPDVQDYELAKRVKEQYPEFYEENFTNILDARKDRRYDLMQQLAKMATGQEWECEPMASYYSD